MKPFILLLKIQLLGLFGINKTLHADPAKAKRTLALAALVVAAVVLFASAYSAGVAQGLVQIGLGEAVPLVAVLVGAIAGAVAAFLKTNGVLFGFKDYDLVMSLPVPTSSVVLSRIASLYAMSLLFGVLVMVRALAQGLPDPKASVAEAMEAVGLREAARDRAKDYSLGMKQRLGLALALIGRPDVLLLDEPFNGLDPEGVRLVRRLLENLATQRECAVLVSSHVLDQLERLVDRYGILREGRLVAQMTAEEVEEACRDYLCVETPEAPRALAVLESAFPDASFTMMPHDAIRLSGVDASEVGRVLLAAEMPVSGLYTHARDIEDYFIGLMGGTSLVRSCSTECTVKGGEGNA